MLEEFTKDGLNDGGVYPFTFLNGDVIISYGAGYPGGLEGGGCGPMGPCRWDYDPVTELLYYDVGSGIIGSMADIDGDDTLEMTLFTGTGHNGKCWLVSCPGDCYGTNDDQCFTIIVDELL